MPDLTPRDKWELSNKNNGADEEADPRHPTAPESLLSQEGASRTGSKDHPSKKGEQGHPSPEELPKVSQPRTSQFNPKR